MQRKKVVIIINKFLVEELTITKLPNTYSRNIQKNNLRLLSSNIYIFNITV